MELEFSLEHAISALGPGLFFMWSLEMICITSDINFRFSQLHISLHAAWGSSE